MEFQKVTAIIQQDKLEAVEAGLKHLGVPGISVTKVKGYGD
ncbi:MAG: P-II family nitrogen regulator [Gammaproteobacteria bacterium]|nr:P-II family nitrogen regulator [Gammaproteobacteria bacterium]